MLQGRYCSEHARLVRAYYHSCQLEHPNGHFESSWRLEETNGKTPVPWLRYQVVDSRQGYRPLNKLLWKGIHCVRVVSSKPTSSPPSNLQNARRNLLLNHTQCYLGSTMLPRLSGTGISMAPWDPAEGVKDEGERARQDIAGDTSTTLTLTMQISMDSSGGSCFLTFIGMKDHVPQGFNGKDLQTSQSVGFPVVDVWSVSTTFRAAKDSPLRRFGSSSRPPPCGIHAPPFTKSQPQPNERHGSRCVRGSGGRHLPQVLPVEVVETSSLANLSL